MEYTQFDRENLKALRTLFDQKMKEIYEETGVLIQMGNGQFTPTEYTVKIKGTITPGSDLKEAKALSDKMNWDRCCGAVDLSPRDFGKRFDFQGERFEICGINTKAWKRPIIAKNLGNGKKYKFSKGGVLSGMGVY